MDYLDVIVHVFTPEAREFYRLEQLWGEAPEARHRGLTAAARRRALSSREEKGRPFRRPFTYGASRARTVDLVTASHALSQLSYSPVRTRSPRHSLSRTPGCFLPGPAGANLPRCRAPLRSGGSSTRRCPGNRPRSRRPRTLIGGSDVAARRVSAGSRRHDDHIALPGPDLHCMRRQPPPRSNSRSYRPPSASGRKTSIAGLDGLGGDHRLGNRALSGSRSDIGVAPRFEAAPR